MFNVRAGDWSKCMNKCPKYNRAKVPFFTDKKEFDELMMWTYNTTTDPNSNNSILMPSLKHFGSPSGFDFTSL